MAVLPVRTSGPQKARCDYFPLYLVFIFNEF
uniref:Uncharacterized protein n=1 Tax=Rhizophora mucronata TaxID=61149 RepID=A0A2P2IXC6_RHIMU